MIETIAAWEFDGKWPWSWKLKEKEYTPNCQMDFRFFWNVFSPKKNFFSMGLIVIDRAFGCWRGLAVEAPRSLTLEQFICSILWWPKCG